MGQDAARITAADFVTPPELAHLRLARHPAGRIGGVRLELASPAGRTRLVASYQQIPLRLLPVSFGAAQPSLVYLVNPTAGLMDGDAHLIHVTAGSGTRAVVVGQSASRIHPCLHEFSTQQWRIDAHEEAVLVVLPGPTIPFRACRYYQRAEINLTRGAHVIWGDVWLAGRYARGDASEWFRFDRIVQESYIRREGRLVHRDRFAWRGPWDTATAAWHFGGCPAFGSLWISGSTPEELLARKRPVRFAAFPTAWGDTICRWLGPADDVTQCVAQTALRVAASLDNGCSVPWLVGNHDLAPVHWFTDTKG